MKKNKMSALISIIIPTFNRAHLIGETLDSIIAQTYQNWECIVVDDGSTDNTDEVLKAYCEKDPRFVFITKPKQLLPKPSASRNLGIKLSKANFINFLDSDDLMLAHKIQKDIIKISSGIYDYTISQNKFFYSTQKDNQKIFWNERLYSKDPLNDFIFKKIEWSVEAPLWKKESLTTICSRFIL